MTTLRTERLVLRRAREDDVDGLFAVFRDAETMRYWSSLPHTSLDETRDWLAAMIDAPPGRSEDFVIEHQGTVVGKVGFFRLPEIGFVLRRDLWGRGLTREAASAVIDHVVETYGPMEMRADVDPRNAASLGLLARLGFVESGRASRTYCVGGVWMDSVYLTRPAGAVTPRRSRP